MCRDTFAMEITKRSLASFLDHAAGALETPRRFLGQSPTLLTRQEILARWPESTPRPRADSLWRTLAHSCELGILVRTGKGTKTEAFRYGLAQAAPRSPPGHGGGQGGWRLSYSEGR